MPTTKTATPRSIAEDNLHDWENGDLDLYAAFVEAAYAAAQAEVERVIDEMRHHTESMRELVERLRERLQELELERTR